jgi:hypothetical protein
MRDARGQQGLGKAGGGVVVGIGIHFEDERLFAFIDAEIDTSILPATE